MHRGYVGVFQNRCFWVWSSAGSQANDRVVWPISAWDLGWLQIPCFGSVHRGSQPLIQLCAHPGAFCLCAQATGHLSGHPPTRGFRCGPQATDWGTHSLGLFGSGPQAAGPLIRVFTLTRGFRCGPKATDWGMPPLGHFGSGAQAAKRLIRASAHP